jgi:23S rRNA (adenine2030-N6)-methyltransferase
MLAYRHQFHAGSPADVFKHAALCQLAVALTRKDKPFVYVDTHAGTGRYDLGHPWAQKNREHLGGIAQIWRRADIPVALAPYIDAVKAENSSLELRFYPGSPRLAARLLRRDDRIVLSELNKQDCERLAQLFAQDPRAQVHLMDGYQALKAFLPPRERRGLILIDSSFDRAKEFSRLAEALVVAYERFATGVFALWYPLMEPEAVRSFERSIVATGIRKILRLELSLRGEDWKEGLRGSAMLIVNPPFQFDELARSMLQWLWQVLSPAGTGRQRVTWLVPERSQTPAARRASVHGE